LFYKNYKNMSFKIRPTHERIFASVQTPGAEEPVEDLVEEPVFLVDEETGEIVEHFQMVPREQSTAYLQGGGADAPPPPPAVSTQPPKDNKFVGLTMRKKTKASFM
jgi:hypothetical protein